MPSTPAAVTLNVSLPAPLKQYVDGRVSSGIYGSASEFVREAIREKLLREQDQPSLESKLLKGLDSGPPITVRRNHFANKKRALLKRHGQKMPQP